MLDKIFTQHLSIREKGVACTIIVHAGNAPAM
jgi:hypothetical protein